MSMVPRAYKQKKHSCYDIHTLAQGKRYHTGLFRKLLPGPRNSLPRASAYMHYIGLCIRSTHVDGTTRVQTKKTQLLRHTHPGPGQALPHWTFSKAAARTAQFPT